MFVEMNYSCDLSWVTKEGKWRPVSSRDHKSWISRANWFRVAEIVIVLWSSQFSLFLNWNCSKGSPQSETRPIVLHDFHGARWRTIRSNDQSWDKSYWIEIEEIDTWTIWNFAIVSMRIYITYFFLQFQLFIRFTFWNMSVIHLLLYTREISWIQFPSKTRIW